MNVELEVIGVPDQPILLNIKEVARKLQLVCSSDGTFDELYMYYNHLC